MDEKNRYCIIAVIVVAVLAIAGWLYHDARRNNAVYSDTDIIVDGIDQRIKDAGKRIDAVSESVEQAETAVTDASERIDRSKESADKIADGLEKCQSRLDDLTQRQGRIRNIIEEVERINRQGTAHP